MHATRLSLALLTTLLLTVGCGNLTPATQHGGDVTTAACIDEQESATAEIQATNSRLRAQIRELEGQLAVARTDLRTLRRSSQRVATTRIGPSPSSSAPAAEEPQPRRETAADEEPRILLRLYGTRPDTPAEGTARGPVPPLEIPPRPANIPGTLSVTGPRRTNAPPPVAIPVAPPVPLASSSPTPAPAPAVDLAVGDYREALTLIRSRRLDEALGRLRRFAQTYPRHAYADNALFWQGEVLYMQRQYQAALEAFRGVVNRYANGNKVPDALLKMARCHQRLGNERQARALLSRVQTQFPNSVAAQVALREDTT